MTKKGESKMKRVVLMKNLLLFLLMILAFLTVPAQDSANQTERQLVENTIQLYCFSTLVKAMQFHCKNLLCFLLLFRKGKNKQISFAFNS